MMIAAMRSHHIQQCQVEGLHQNTEEDIGSSKHQLEMKSGETAAQAYSPSGHHPHIEILHILGPPQPREGFLTLQQLHAIWYEIIVGAESRGFFCVFFVLD